ncbi:MAG: Na+/solute symporter [Planctomycetaceae bacterium]|nr:Na+/solute symporter [Planctomycetaceae bacterium]
MSSLLFAAAAAGAVTSKPHGGIGTLVALAVFILASGWIGILANRAMSHGSFMKGFFLGNRGLGAWALALTATVQSGGTFMGFPSLVYTHGWIVALWIGSYMVVPITGFGILGKRLAQLSRRLGAITIPDFFRERFGSPALGLLASICILFYMSIMMVAQFKAGAIVMKLSWPGTESLAMSEEFSNFVLPGKQIERFRQKGFDPKTIDKLETLKDQKFQDVAEFETKLGEVLSIDELKAHKSEIVTAATPIDILYFVGLGIFTLTVVGYTMAGGFLAAVWTDLFQSIMMFFGVILLLVLALWRVGGLELASVTAVQQTGPGFIYGPGYDPSGVGRQFLPLSLAISFFVLWVYSGLSSPAGMVRIMACDSTQTIRRSIYLLSIYNCFIYIPLIVICVCGRTLFPNLGAHSDEIIPRMALVTTEGLPLSSFWAGLILAAPFGAIMATVSSYLVVISSGLVRDIYQRFLDPNASEARLKFLSHTGMIVVGLVAVAANIQPVKYLQALVVFSSTGTACTFLIPALMAAYWRRASVAGVLAAMFLGACTALTLYSIGIFNLADRLRLPEQLPIGQDTSLRPYYLFGYDPIIWGLSISLVAGVVVSLVTPPPDPKLISKLFDAQPAKV